MICTENFKFFDNIFLEDVAYKTKFVFFTVPPKMVHQTSWISNFRHSSQTLQNSLLQVCEKNNASQNCCCYTWNETESAVVVVVSGHTVLPKPLTLSFFVWTPRLWWWRLMCPSRLSGPDYDLFFDGFLSIFVMAPDFFLAGVKEEVAVERELAKRDKWTDGEKLDDDDDPRVDDCVCGQNADRRFYDASDWLAPRKRNDEK